jgi:hypothetical protein
VQRTTAREDLENQQRKCALKRVRTIHIAILVSVLSIALENLQIKGSLRGGGLRNIPRRIERISRPPWVRSASGNLFNAANFAAPGRITPDDVMWPAADRSSLTP